MDDAIRIRARTAQGATEVQLLMPHPMETGLRADDQGRLVPAHFITDVVVSLADRTLLTVRMGMAVSRDPLLSFRFQGGQAGEPVTVTWHDNTGAVRTGVGLIA